MKIVDRLFYWLNERSHLRKKVQALQKIIDKKNQVIITAADMYQEEKNKNIQLKVQIELSKPEPVGQ